MTSREFTEYQASVQLDPDPLDVIVRQNAELLAMLGNSLHRPTQPYRPVDFLFSQEVAEADREASESWASTLAEMRAAGKRPN